MRDFDAEKRETSEGNAEDLAGVTYCGQCQRYSIEDVDDIVVADRYPSFHSLITVVSAMLILSIETFS